MNNNLIIHKDNLFTKIKKFFLNFFKKDKLENEITENNTDISNNKSAFVDNLIIKRDEDEFKILKLQQDYKSGKILEENMTDEEHKKLIELYKMQNENLKNKIEIKKKILRKKLDDLKVS